MLAINAAQVRTAALSAVNDNNMNSVMVALDRYGDDLGMNRAVVGTSLIGAHGATSQDQNKIDETVAGLCGSATWTKTECAAHAEAGR